VLVIQTDFYKSFCKPIRPKGQTGIRARRKKWGLA